MHLDVGVSVGVEASGVEERKEGSKNEFSVSGASVSITSGRLSYTLGLVGPCYSIDTACSSALAALHIGAGEVRRLERENGVGIGTKVLSQSANVELSVAGMTSPLGRCHTFDKRADGYSRGEGCGAFLLS